MDDTRNQEILPAYRDNTPLSRPGTDERLESSKQRILELEQSIKQGVVDAGLVKKPGDVKVQIGVEVEFYQIAGEEYAKKREREWLENKDNNSKHQDDYMPESAREESLWKSHFSQTTKRDGKKVPLNKIICEPPFGMNVSNELKPHITESGAIVVGDPEKIAIAQKEIISNPLPPLGAAKWMEKIGQHIIEKAEETGLKRTEIVSGRENALPNSIHLNISVQYRNEKGKWKSVFVGPRLKPVSISDVKQKYGKLDKTWPDEIPDPFENDNYALEKPWELSPIGFSVGNAVNEVLSDCTFVFTRSSDAYNKRLNNPQYAQPSEIGFFGRKIISFLRTAMFRGEEKCAFRSEAGERKIDGGPVRIELRLPDVSILGHPNKDAYPQEAAAPYEAIQTLLYMMDKGIKDHLKQKAAGTVPKKTIDHSEALLLRSHEPLPNRNEAIRRFMDSQISEAIFGSKEHMRDIVAQAEQYDRIREQENNTRLREPYKHTVNHSPRLERMQPQTTGQSKT